MLKFLQTVAAVVLGHLVATAIIAMLSLFGLLVVVSAVSSGSAEARVAARHVPSKAVLVMDLGFNLMDTPVRETPSDLINHALAGGGPRILALHDILRALDAATKDPRVETILIRGSLGAASVPQIAEIRTALARFRSAGKHVVAHLDAPSIRDYYLASASDTVALHPAAELGVQGLAANMPYFGGALKKYGVGVQTTKVGKYKSAVEPFTAERMSDADKTQTRALLDSLWTGLTDDIAASRKISPDTLRKIADEHGILDAEDALAAKLVDKTAYLDDIIADLIQSGDEDPATGSFAQVALGDYLKTLPKPPVLDTSDDKVVVLYAEGEIVDGNEASGEAFGGEWLAGEVRRLRRDDAVKALVLRVNSPGGSAFASEVARRELDLFKKSGRPVVVSMGGYAASGGYWISAGANRIFADKNTVTGSIGVFGLMFNVKELATGFGVNFDGVKTSRYADIESLARPKTEAELALLQKFTDRIYDNFIELVAEGRKLPEDTVRDIAQGRVWSGADALRHGLVDELGGLGAAVAHARKSAKLKADAPVVHLPERAEPGQVLAALFAGDHGEDPVAGARSPLARVAKLSDHQLRRLARFNDRRHVYARLPYLLDIE